MLQPYFEPSHRRARQIGHSPLPCCIRLAAPDQRLPGAVRKEINVSQLKEYRDGAQGFPDRPIPITRPDPVVSDDNGAPEWTVERILDSRKRGKRDQYLVLWRGYPLSEATWEPIENMDRALDLVIEYNKRSKAVLGAVTTNMPRSAWVKPPRISSSPSRAA